MSDNLKEKVSALGERLKITGADVTRKMSAGMSSMSFKLKELLEGPATPTPAEKLVEEATTITSSLESKSLEEVKWSLNLHICDLINQKRIDGGEIIRSVKKRMVLSRPPRVQYLCMVLLEMLVNNCEKGVSDQVASEGVVDELVKIAHDPNTVSCNRDKALMLIRDWRESCCELQYLLYTHEQTYKRLQCRGVTDSGDMKGSSSKPISSADQLSDHDQIHVDDQRNTYYNDKLVLLVKEKQIRKQVLDVARNSIELLSTVISSSSPYNIYDPSPSDEELVTALVEQCRRSQYEVQRMINNANKGDDDDDDDDDDLLFEDALNVNDHLHEILCKYHEDQLQGRLGRNHNEAPAAVHHQLSSLVAFPDDDHQYQTAAQSSKSSLINQQVVDDDLDEIIFGNHK